MQGRVGFHLFFSLILRSSLSPSQPPSYHAWTFLRGTRRREYHNDRRRRHRSGRCLYIIYNIIYCDIVQKHVLRQRRRSLCQIVNYYYYTIIILAIKIYNYYYEFISDRRCRRRWGLTSEPRPQIINERCNNDNTILLYHWSYYHSLITDRLCSKNEIIIIITTVKLRERLPRCTTIVCDYII